MKVPSPKSPIISDLLPGGGRRPVRAPSATVTAPAGDPVSPRDPAGPVSEYYTRVSARGVPPQARLRMVLPTTSTATGVARGTNPYEWLNRNGNWLNPVGRAPTTVEAGTHDFAPTHYDPQTQTATWDLGTQGVDQPRGQTFASRLIVPGVGEGEGFAVWTRPGDQETQIAPHPFGLAFVRGWPRSTALALQFVNGRAPGSAYHWSDDPPIFADPFVVLDRTRENSLQFAANGTSFPAVRVAPFTEPSTSVSVAAPALTLDNLAPGARAFTGRGDALENLVPFAGTLPAGNDRVIVLWPGFAGGFGQWPLLPTGGRVDVDLGRARLNATGGRLRPYSELRYARPDLVGAVELQPLGNYVVSLADSEGGGAASVRSTGRGIMVQNLPRQPVNLVVRRGNTPGAQPIPLTVTPGTLDAPTVVRVPESVTAPTTVQIRLVDLPGYSIVRENGVDVTSPGSWDGQTWVLADRARTPHTLNVEYPDARGTRTLSVPAPVGAAASVEVNAAPLQEVEEVPTYTRPPVALVGLPPDSRVFESGVDVTLPGEWRETSMGTAWVLTEIAAGRHALELRYPDGSTRSIVTEAPVPGGGTILADARPQPAGTGGGASTGGAGGGGGGAGAEVGTVDIALFGLPDGSNVMEGGVDVTSPVAQRSYGSTRAWTLLGRSRRSHTFTFQYPGGGTRTVTVDAPNVNESVVTVDAAPAPAEGGTGAPSPDAGGGSGSGGDAAGFALVIRNLPAGAKVYSDTGEDVTPFGARSGNDWTLLNIARGTTGSRTFRVRYTDGTEYPLTVTPGALTIVSVDAPSASPPAIPPPATPTLGTLVIRNIAEGWHVFVDEVAPSTADLGRRQVGRSLALERQADGTMTGRIALAPGARVQFRALPAVSPAELGPHYWLRVGPSATVPTGGETLTLDANGVGGWPLFAGGLVRVRDNSSELRTWTPFANGDGSSLTPAQQAVLNEYIANSAATARAAMNGTAPAGYPQAPEGFDYERWLNGVWDALSGNDQYLLAGRLANVPVTLDGVTTAIWQGRGPIAGQTRWERLAREFGRYVVRNGDRLTVPTGMPFWAFQRVTGTDWSLAELATFAGYARRPLPTPANPRLAAILAVVPRRGDVAKLGLIAPGATFADAPKALQRPTAPAGDVSRADMMACAQRAWERLGWDAQGDVVDRMMSRFHGDAARYDAWVRVMRWRNQGIANLRGRAAHPAPMTWAQLQPPLDIGWDAEMVLAFCEAAGSPIATMAPAPVSPLPTPMRDAPVIGMQMPGINPKGLIQGVAVPTPTRALKRDLSAAPSVLMAPVAPSGLPVGVPVGRPPAWRPCVDAVLGRASGWEQQRIIHALAERSRQTGAFPFWQTLRAEYDRRRARQQVSETPPRLTLGELDHYLGINQWNREAAAFLCDFVGAPMASELTPAPVRPLPKGGMRDVAMQPVSTLAAILPVKYRAAGDAPMPPPQWVVYASPGGRAVPNPTERDFLYVDSVVDTTTGAEGERYFLGWVPLGPWNISARWVDYNPARAGSGATDYGPVAVEIARAQDVRDLTLNDVVTARQNLLDATPGTAPLPWLAPQPSAAELQAQADAARAGVQQLEVATGFRFTGLAQPNSDAQRVFIDGRAVTLDANGAVATTPGVHEVLIEPPGVRATLEAPLTGTLAVNVQSLLASQTATGNTTPALKNAVGVLGIQTDGRRCGPFAAEFIQQATASGAVPTDVLGRVVCEFDQVPVSDAVRARYPAGTVFAVKFAAGYGMVVNPMTPAEFQARAGWAPYEPFFPPPSVDGAGRTFGLGLAIVSVLAGAAGGALGAVEARG